MTPERRRITPAILAGVLVALNAFLIRELFRIEYLNQMGSIEGAYIGISRYLLGHWRDLSWFPLWYGGIPFQNTYPPLLHVLVAGWSAWTSATPAHAHHIVTAILYCLGSAAVFALVYSLSSNLVSSTIAGVLHSTVSPAAILVSAIRHDAGSLWGPRRLQNLIQYGEGPHLTSLVLLPVAVALIHRMLTRRRPADFCLGAIAIAAVALSNYLGLFALVVMTGCYLLACQGSIRDWLAVAATGVAAYALASPWIPPSTLLAVKTNAQWVGGSYPFGGRQVIFLLTGAAAIVLLSVLIRRFDLALRFWILSAAAFSGITLTAFWLHTAVMPQPERYHLQMEMALLGLIATLLGRNTSHAALALVFALVLAVSIPGAIHVRRYAREHIRPIDIAATIEYRTADWFARNAPGDRVFVPGSSYIWLNAFGAQPQLMGGFDQGITNPMLPGVAYQTFTGMNSGDREGVVAIALLKAYGVRYVAAGGPQSREFYKPYANPHKFDSLPQVWQEGDDAIYQVIARTASLAHVVRAGELPPVLPDVTHTELLEPYLKVLDDPSRDASLQWKSPGSISVTADLQPGDLVSLQITYDRGWQASVNQAPASLRADSLGQTVLQTACTGRCTAELVYTGGLEARIAQIARSLTVLLGLAWIVLEGIIRRRA